MAHEAGFLGEKVRATLKHSRISFICQKDPKDIGWWTTAEVKYKMAYAMRSVFQSTAIYYADEMICANPWLDETNRLQITKKKFEDQLPKYKIVIAGLSMNNPISTPRVSISGKTTKEGKVSSSFTDDIAFCISANLFFINMLNMRTIPNFNYEEIFEY
jgi:hypothetical protein